MTYTSREYSVDCLDWMIVTHDERSEKDGVVRRHYVGLDKRSGKRVDLPIFPFLFLNDDQVMALVEMGYPGWDPLPRLVEAAQIAGLQRCATEQTNLLALELEFERWVASLTGKSAREGMTERRDRFMEEALELYQSLGGTEIEVANLADHVFDRPVGGLQRELAQAFLTLLGISAGQPIPLSALANEELRRLWSHLPKTRRKRDGQEDGVLPGSTPTDMESDEELLEQVARSLGMKTEQVRRVAEGLDWAQERNEEHIDFTDHGSEDTENGEVAHLLERARGNFMIGEHVALTLPEYELLKAHDKIFYDSDNRSNMIVRGRDNALNSVRVVIHNRSA